MDEGELTPTAVPNIPRRSKILVLRLKSCDPNPFNPRTSIQFDVPTGGARVRLQVYNLRGQLVATLLDEVRQAGHHRVTWDGRDNRGALVGSGVYVARIAARGRTDTLRMTLIR
jgi:flagellar hook assembly protein FlgD